MADRCLPPQRTTEWTPRGLLVSGIYIFTCVDNVRICCRDIRVCVCVRHQFPDVIQMFRNVTTFPSPYDF